VIPLSTPNDSSKWSRFLALVLSVSVCVLGLSGCHPRPLFFIIHNQGLAVHAVKLACPGGSATTDLIPSNGQFSPSLLIHDAGTCSLQFLDPAGQQHENTIGIFQKYSTGAVHIYIDDQFHIRTNMNFVGNRPIQPGEPMGSFGKSMQPAPLWKTKKK
jgi:hypothetical protein